MSIKAKIMILLKYGGSWVLMFLVQLVLLAMIWRRTRGGTRLLVVTVWALFFAAYLLVPIDFVFSLTFPVNLYRSMVIPALIWQFAVGFAALGLIAGLAWMLVRYRMFPVADRRRMRPSEALERLLARSGMRGALWGLFFAGFLFAASGLHQALRPPVVVRHVIAVRGLKAPVTILHLTDTHAGYFCSEEDLRRVVDLARELKPDLVVLTGDQLHGAHAPFAALLRRGLTGLQARYGVYQVAGNHDHRTGVGLLYDALAPLGVVSLHNRHVVVPTDAGPLAIAGIDDTRYGGDLQAALADLPQGVPVLLLSHRPDVLAAAAAAGVDVVFSGHTHGGQICLFGLCLSDVEGRLRRGEYRLQGTTLIVSSGVGTTGLPLRMFSPAEVDWIVLEPASAESPGARPGEAP
ncbi:MAG: hypothetical protein CVU65_17505 [Deltaproteobacteria bacterium HGW-Deltaproteobacteria-22]|nr:MAG: hypothetical protein CVU65_17505 [Deltaproteobacteria bacterium HGW-Deltaproteobacteria-22]